MNINPAHYTRGTGIAALLSARMAAGVTAAGFLTISAPALAGTIQGVTAQPSSASTGDPVTVTVTGTGTCANGVVVDFGDGDSQEKAGDLPLVFNAKTYSQSGVHTVAAAKKPGTLGCNGSASTTVSMTQPGDITMWLCSVLRCRDGVRLKTPPLVVSDDTKLTVKPQITSFSVSPHDYYGVSRAGFLHITGWGFGSAPGKVYLRLYEPIEQDVFLPVDSWTDTKIRVRVPGGIRREIPDQEAAFYVQTQDGVNSNLEPTHFTRDAG